MGLFDSFKGKAEKKLDQVKNPKDYVDKSRFKDPYQEPKENHQPKENKKDKKKKSKEDKRYLDPFSDDFSDIDNFGGGFNEDNINLYPAQKPESFHFFILENQYQDLERAIRGVKDVWDKENEKWVIKKKSNHCFTDEESEEIVRTAQSHLSSDIKLAIFNKAEYPILLNSIYEQLWTLFKEIMDYRFGRFGNLTKQQEMKLQAVNIFNMLTMRIKANYSRAVEGRENERTHDSVKGQESLQQTERRGDFSRGYT